MVKRERVRKAIEKSIKHWEEIFDTVYACYMCTIGLNEMIIDYKSSGCPLCKLFNNCCSYDKCPISKYSGDTGCANTPWVFVNKYYSTYRPPLNLVEAVEEEVKFLYKIEKLYKEGKL